MFMISWLFTNVSVQAAHLNYYFFSDIKFLILMTKPAFDKKTSFR